MRPGWEMEHWYDTRLPLLRGREGLTAIANIRKTGPLRG